MTLKVAVVVLISLRSEVLLAMLASIFDHMHYLAQKNHPQARVCELVNPRLS